jgi:type IV pilus assembly protein PilX
MNKYVVKAEKGAALIISMIFLLVLTIIGLAGMDVTGLEEKMAGNMRDRNIAFQAAEAALRDGENYLQTQAILPAFDGSDGLYSLTTNGDKNWNIVTWSSSAAVRSYTGPGFSELNSTAAYIIEDLAAASSNDSLEAGVPVDNKRYYRITARAEGLSSTTAVMLQTVYKR